MSKSYQKSSKGKAQPAPEGLKPLQIDETIVCSHRLIQSTSTTNKLPPAIAEFFERLESLDSFVAQELIQGSDGELGSFGLALLHGLAETSSNPEELQERIEAIIGEDLDVTPRKLRQYSKYLTKAISHPCYLTGADPFEWEEDFLSSESGIPAEYEGLKQERASYTDVFQLKKFSTELDEADGLLVEVERTHDRKSFTLPLINLMITDESSPNYQLIDDYCMWLVEFE
ncbi:MAG: hypothetical protein HC825_06885 [Oscillatoriales cyanobacterium RM1_1_9]|nr:hypothetical protein [Oscillatoriales cyanobacterium SM2_3_0]NJO47583.1 hypothetical protein [Oscillatoriales cyanobacterium RM2_1_1]NJO71476.1 hypothetical protein [Oscillatoriales cyanobacterium RM1_1_9]